MNKTKTCSETTWIPPTIASSSFCSSPFVKPHSSSSNPSADPCWDAIRRACSSFTSGSLSLTDLRFLHRLGAGDIGSVYLVEIKSPESTAGSNSALFAVKVMDKKEIAGRNKEGRAGTEKEILEMLDHPFLPTLYAAIDSPKWSCLVTEFCPSGDLHVDACERNYRA